MKPEGIKEIAKVAVFLTLVNSEGGTCPVQNEARWPIASLGACMINIYVYT